MGLGFSIQVAPGVRVRASSRGVRTSLGPRAARVHVGAGRTAVSTGAGPVTLYGALGGRVRSSRGGRPTARAADPTPAQSEKLAQAARLARVLEDLRGVHRADFAAATPPVAPPLVQPDVVGVHRRHERTALSGIRPWRRAERAAARRRAEAGAIAELSASSRAAQEQRRLLQRQLDGLWAALVANDPDVVLATLAEAFEDNTAAAAAVAVSGAEASLVVLVPPADVVPDQTPGTTAAGNVSVRRMPRGQRDELYTEVVMGHVLVTIKEAFAVAPGLLSARVVACRPGSSGAPGQVGLECLLAGRWARSALTDIPWSTTDAHTAARDSAAELVLRLRSGKKLQPLDLRDHPAIATVLDAVDTSELLA